MGENTKLNWQYSRKQSHWTRLEQHKTAHQSSRSKRMHAKATRFKRSTMIFNDMISLEGLATKSQPIHVYLKRAWVCCSQKLKKLKVQCGL